MRIKRSLLKFRGKRCLNCDYPLELTDRFCPRCGQVNSTKKLEFSDFLSEFFQGFFAYDSRLQRSLRVLLFKPGLLAKDYIKGKRMSYANPFRLYLSASIVFFIIAGFSSSFQNINLIPQHEELNEQLSNTPKDSLAEIQKKIDSASLKNNLQPGAIEVDFSQKQEESYKDIYVSQNQLDSMGVLLAFQSQLSIFLDYNKETQVFSPKTAMDDLHYQNSRYNHWLYKKSTDINLFLSNPQLFIGYFLNKLPFIIFFYLPVFALFVWLLYIRKGLNYMEHLIFTFYTQTAFFVLYTAGLLFDLLSSLDWGLKISSVIFAIYLYKSLRKFYEQGRFKTIVKFLLLNIIFFILASVAIILSVIASFALF